ncbi:MAG: cobalt-precorrin-6A reductase [Cyanobacteria bacterium P01_F01_bin.143]
MKKIWLIGGTKDSAEIAKAISSAQIPSIVVTVTTASAKNLYPANFSIKIGCFSSEAMAKFCSQENIIAIVDASHPFAMGVSQNAIATAQLKKIPYLRYERNSCQSSDSHQFLILDSFDTLLNGNYLDGHRVLLTVGCKVLPQFKTWHHRSTLFTRVLPKVNSMQTALDSGFLSDRIIAIRPPISAELETVLWQQWKISLVVTKASGKLGGENIKRQVAKSLGIALITIARPKIFYPQQTSCIKKIVAFCQQYNSSNLT